MKLAIVYNPLDNKMREDTYSYIYRGMFNAVVEKFNPEYIIEDCDAQEIDADVIIFWDVNSCHHIKIKGIEKHLALKMEYMSDPYQVEIKGIYQRYNMSVHKLSAEQRIKRVMDRGIKYIISSNKEGYNRWLVPIIGENAEKMLMYFPHAPWFEAGYERLSNRYLKILANGSVSNNGKDGYDFRYWAFQRSNVTIVKHFLSNGTTPMGKDYGDFLKQWAGGLALCDVYPVPKYYEMPMAGCVTFMQYFKECEELGFKDMESCVYVNKDNFDARTKDFVEHPLEYQTIADNGRKLMEENYTANHFAEFLYKRIESKIGGR